MMMLDPTPAPMPAPTPRPPRPTPATTPGSPSPPTPLTCEETLAAAHESATLLQAGWQLADIVDSALEGAVAACLEDAHRHPLAEAAAAELLGTSCALHGVEARPWLLRPPHAAPHERSAVLHACGQSVKRVLAATLGGDDRYGAARAALTPALRVAYERHGVLSTREDADERHVRSLLALVDGAGFREGWGCRVDDDEATRTADYGGPVADAPAGSSEALRVIAAGRGRSLPPALRRRLWRARVGPSSMARRVARDVAKLRYDGKPCHVAHPAAGAALNAAYKSFPRAWRHVLGEDDAKLVEDAAGRALIELHALKGTSLGQRASTCAVALACLGVRRSFDDGDRFTPAELTLVLLRLLSLPPGHSADGASGGAQRAVTELDERDAELARHLRVASGGPARLVALLAGRVDGYLTTVFPLDALLFAWDHCLLDGWREELPRFLCDALGLLRKQLLAATTPAELELALRDAPRSLRTCDVRDAWRDRQRRKVRLGRSLSTSHGENLSPTRMQRSATSNF